MTTPAERCYVVYGTGFDPVKIKGMQNRNDLVQLLRTAGFAAKSSRLNPHSPSGKRCKEVPTPY